VNLRYGVRKFRAAFLIFVTILHELAHVKVRTSGIQISPDDWYHVEGVDPTDSGSWMEKKVFGGLVHCSTNNKFDKPLEVQTRSTTITLSDEWVKSCVANLVNDNIDRGSDLRYPQPLLPSKTKSKGRNRGSNFKIDISRRCGSVIWHGKPYRA